MFYDCKYVKMYMTKNNIVKEKIFTDGIHLVVQVRYLSLPWVNSSDFNFSFFIGWNWGGWSVKVPLSKFGGQITKLWMSLSEQAAIIYFKTKGESMDCL